MNNTVVYATIMLMAGLGIPVMAAINSGLGTKLQNPSLASVILLLLGSCIAVAILIITEGVPKALFSSNTPGYLYLGGLFIAFYIFSVTWIAPRFGIANAISFVLIGQLIAMTVIDHLGLFGAAKVTLTLQRTAGLILMLGGVLMVLNPIDTH